MADSDLSLLFRLRGENTQAKAVLADTRAAVTALKTSFGSDLTSMQGIAKSALADIGENVNAFVGQRIPLIGGAFLRVTSNLKGFNDELKRGGPQTEALARQIDNIARTSGKSTTEITRFLTTFTRLEGQAARNDAAFRFFGGSVDLIGNKTAKFLPELEQAGAAMAGLTTETGAAAVATAGLAGPIAIAIAALAAEVVIVVELTQQIFALTKASADYQGKLFDLSQQVGVSVETLSALEVAARTTGGSIDGLVQSLGIFQRRLEESVEDRGGKAAVTLRKLGVDATDTEAALRQTIAALARMPEGFRQTATAMELFGRGGKAVLAVAKESKGDIDDIINRLRGLGLVTTEQAKLADEFNDQLVLLQVQLRGLGTQAIPVVLGVMQDLSRTMQENRDVFLLLQGVVKGLALAIAFPLKTALTVVRFEAARSIPILQALASIFNQIKQSVEFIAGHPVTFPGGTAGPATLPTTTPTEDQRDPFTENLKDEVEARKRLQGVLNFAFAERQRQAEASIALAQREFEAGRRTRQQLLDSTIDGTRKQSKAEIDGLEVQRSIKLQEQALTKDDVQKRTQIANEILAIDTQIASKRAAQQKNEADLRARAQLDERRAQLAHQQADLETLTNAGQERIAVIQELLSEERIEREAALAEIERIENAAIKARGQLLKRELELAGVGPERQAVLDKIKAIEVDRSTLERTQAERRKQVTREEMEGKRDILLDGLSALLQVEQIQGEARIATVQSLAALRIKTEEEAVREILAIRLDLIDSEIEATKARQDAAKNIVDPKERRATEAQIANDLRVLNAQRVAIQEQGNREIDNARQQDIDNQRRYADELQDIQERIRNVQLDAAEELITLMRIHFASRRDLIRAQLRLDVEDENARHRNAQQGIAALRQENAESNRTKAEKLQVEQEINQLEEAEAERHRLALKGIKDQAKQDEKEATPLGRIDLDLDNLREFANIIEGTIVPLGQILTSTFQQVSDAIGQTVANWVLLGETGPAVMRKMLAQALASIAAEAAVQAIKELALGFATLFFNPAESASHFTAAAIWGSIGGVAAIAGRGVAGDLFKQRDRNTSTGSGSSSSAPNALQTITQGRNQSPAFNVTVKLVGDDSKLANFITASVVKNIGDGGEIREVIANDRRGG